jgi:TctA family transporter
VFTERPMSAALLVVIIGLLVLPRLARVWRSRSAARA